jgi:uncharacterized membrane protein YphA (DoxX/SURF4 family)
MGSAQVQLLLATREGPAARWAAPVRWLSGTVLVVFGAAKFTAHAQEVDSFESYGLPAPEVFVYLIGTLEIVAGLLLIAGLVTRLVAAVMAGNMLGAIALSGIGEGEVLPSLTVAPLLLAGMLFLLWVGPGGRALDGRLLANHPAARSGPR